MAEQIKLAMVCEAACNELYPQMAKLKLFREAMASNFFDVTELVPCEPDEDGEDGNDLRAGLYQLLSEVTQGYDRFAAKLSEIHNEPAPSDKG